MLKSNKAVFILALVMAIALWAYVLGTVDPVRTVTLRNIPVKLTNQAVLDEAGLVITEMDTEEVNVTFTAKRSLANKIKAEDFHVTCDLSEVKLGNNVIKVELSRPSNITLESVSSEYISITADQFISAEKPIEVTIVNPTKEETEPKIIRMSDEEVTISGASSAVERVDKVLAELDALRMGNEPTTISVELKAVDESKEEVSGINFSFKNVSVTAVLQSTKTVPLEVPVTGVSSGSVNRNVTAPDRVTLKGDDSALEKIESITCEPVDLTELYESEVIPLIPVLPDEVELAEESENLVLQVTVYNAGTTEMTFDATDINITGVGEGRSVKIHDVKIRATVKGLSTVTSSLSKSNFNLSADVSDIEDGTHTIDLKITSDMTGVDLIIPNPDKITVDIVSE